MAVPPLGAKVIIEAILKSFAGIPYETEPSKWEEELNYMLLTGEKRKKKSSSAKVKLKVNEKENDIAEQQSLSLEIK
jgi:DNA (cytosine-5)-methyltransferase 1